MKLCSDFFAAGSAKSNLGSFSPLILHKIQKNGVKDQFEITKLSCFVSWLISKFVISQ